MIIRLTIAALTILTAAALQSCTGKNVAPADKQSSAQELVIRSGGQSHLLKVELAQTDEERRIGLMFRESMPVDSGMLFYFGPTSQIISMWMKNTLIPLDMAFIDNKGVIVKITPMTSPQSLESLPSGKPVISVLEVNGGVFETLGISVGDTIEHPLFRAN